MRHSSHTASCISYTDPQRIRIGAAHGCCGTGTFGSDAPFHAREVTTKIPSRSTERFPVCDDSPAIGPCQPRRFRLQLRGIQHLSPHVQPERSGKEIHPADRFAPSTLSSTRTVCFGRANFPFIMPTIMQPDATTPSAGFDPPATPSRNPRSARSNPVRHPLDSGPFGSLESGPASAPCLSRFEMQDAT